MKSGYKSALQANGIPFDEKLVLNGDFERKTAYEALNSLFAIISRSRLTQYLLAMTMRQ